MEVPVTRASIGMDIVDIMSIIPDGGNMNYVCFKIEILKGVEDKCLQNRS